MPALRSRTTTIGRNAAGARALWRATGMTEGDFGKPIVAIATYNSVRIIGYLRAPIIDEPKLGTRVQVRTRGPRREVGAANIVEIGTQLEAVAPALASSFKLASVELGLPISVSLPPNLRIRPGEVVDLTLLPKTD